MGTYEELKNAIADVIKTNGNNEISGAHLQSVLKTIVSTLGGNATFAGVATPSTNPGTPDQNIFYLATDAGTYVNFGNIVVNKGEVAILSNKTNKWVKTVSGLAIQQQLTELSEEVGGLADEIVGIIDEVISISATSSGYSNFFFENEVVIPKDYYIKGINIEGNITGYLIQPNGTYVEVKLLTDIIKELPYQLPAECGGLKLNGTGKVTLSWSKYIENPQGLEVALNELKKDIQDTNDLINGKNPIQEISITSDKSGSYVNCLFDNAVVIPKGYYIRDISYDQGVTAYLIQPNGSYVEVKLISAIAKELPYQLPADCGGLKINGVGTITIEYTETLDESIKGLKDKVNEIATYIPKIHIPSKIYGVVGDTIQIYYRSIVECTDINNYYIRINGDGASYPRYHELTPTSVGNKKMVCEVYDNAHKLLTSKEFTLVVSEQPSQPSSMKRVSFFGDSLTEPAIYPAELKRMLTSDDVANGVFPQGKNLQNIEFVGAMSKKGVNYYGVGGWGWNNYAQNTDAGLRFYTADVGLVAQGENYEINGVVVKATSKRVTDMSFAAKVISGGRDNLPSTGTFNNTSITYTSYAEDTSNPLWNGDKPSFKYYFEQIGVSGEVSVISFLLGWNLVYMDLNRYEQDVRTLITTAHSEYPSARFCILGIQLPSFNGGLAYNYPNDAFFSDMQKVITSVHAYNEWLQSIAKDYDWVDYVDVASQFDSENNMPQREKNVNLRNERKELQGYNGVHPSDKGYYQIADVVYRYLCATIFVA